MQNTGDKNKAITLCVGFELQYSPFEKSAVENFADSIPKKGIEFVFDVTQSVEIDQEVVILFSNQSKPTQRLPMLVRSCENIAEDHVRIRLYTQETKAPTSDDTDNTISIPIGKGQAIPYGIIASCPSCHQTNMNRFFANQEGGWNNGIMPLYECSVCESSLTLLSLLDAIRENA